MANTSQTSLSPPWWRFTSSGIGVWEELPDDSDLQCCVCGEPAKKRLLNVRRITNNEFTTKQGTGYALCAKDWGKRNV